MYPMVKKAPVREGDFGCVPIAGEVGRLIRFGEFLNGNGFGRWEHAFVVTSSDALGGGIQICEAEPGGARVRPLHYDPDQVLWSSGKITLTQVQRQAIRRAALGYQNVPYSALDYFALAAHRLHIPAPHLRAYIKSTGHMICSQLVDTVYNDAGVHLFQDHRWPGEVTPADLAELIS